MEVSISQVFSKPSMRSLEAQAFRAVVERGEPIPLDVAAGLMEEGVMVEQFEKKLEGLNCS